MRTEKGKNDHDQNDNQGSLHGRCDMTFELSLERQRKEYCIVDLFADRQRVSIQGPYNRRISERVLKGVALLLAFIFSLQVNDT